MDKEYFDKAKQHLNNLDDDMDVAARIAAGIALDFLAQDPDAKISQLEKWLKDYQLARHRFFAFFDEFYSNVKEDDVIDD